MINKNMMIEYCQFIQLSCVHRPPDTFKKVPKCVNYKIKQKQSNFERNAKKILCFEHFLSQIRDIKKIAC
jgi:hypothetical protein